MKLIDDQNYLKDSQYKTTANLQARVKIHRLFSTNRYGWFPWEFERLNVRPGEKVLDLGCGPAELWKSQAMRLPPGVLLVLCDFSIGMAQAAQGALRADSRFRFGVADAQRIPFETASFDVVTANHMLYHVPDIGLALREIRRVLRPGGRLVAATNGVSHLRQLYGLIRQVLPDYKKTDSSAERFGLENGPALLREVFEHVRTEIYEDSLFVTEAQPLVDYVGSMWGMARWDEEVQARLNFYISQEIERSGGFQIDKSSGVILANPAD